MPGLFSVSAIPGLHFAYNGHGITGLERARLYPATDTETMEEIMTRLKQSLRSITAQDLYALQLLTDVRLSPDGRHVVYGIQRVDKKTQKKYANLWMAPTDGSGERQFTQGDQTDASPRWSPDGRSLALSLIHI